MVFIPDHDRNLFPLETYFMLEIHPPFRLFHMDKASSLRRCGYRASLYRPWVWSTESNDALLRTRLCRGGDRIIRELIVLSGPISRYQLSREVCARLNRRRADGKHKDIVPCGHAADAGG